MIGILYVLFSAIYYEIVIQLVETKAPKLRELAHIHHEVVLSNNVTHIEILVERSDYIFKSIKDDASRLYGSFQIIAVLSICNFSFFFQHIVNFLVTKRIGRRYEVP